MERSYFITVALVFSSISLFRHFAISCFKHAPRQNSRKKCGNTDSPVARVPTAFLVLPNLHLCFYNSIDVSLLFEFNLTLHEKYDKRYF